MCLIKHYAMETWGREGIASSAFLTSTTKRRFSASRPSRSNPRESPHHTYFVGDWVGPKIGLDGVVERELSCPFPVANPGVRQIPTRGLVAVRSGISRL